VLKGAGKTIVCVSTGRENKLLRRGGYGVMDLGKRVSPLTQFGQLKRLAPAVARLNIIRVWSGIDADRAVRHPPLRACQQAAKRKSSGGARGVHRHYN
jgi:hypothetical protein